MKWDLSAFYQAINDPQIEKDLTFLAQIIEEYTSLIYRLENNIKQPAPIETVLEKQIEIDLTIDKISTFAHLAVSTDAKNQAARSLEDKVEKLITNLTKPSVTFQKWLASLVNLKELIHRSDFLKAHAFHLFERAENTSYLLDEEVEQTISILSQTGSNAWTKLYGTLSSTQLVEITTDNKTQKLPLPIVRNMAYENDPQIRKIAYEAELKSYQPVEESLAAAINSIKGEVIEICKMRKFTSPLYESLYHSRLEKSALDAMLEAINESLPVLRKYLLKKAKNLGHAGALPFYDLFAPQGELSFKFTYEDAQKFIIENFQNFSNELSGFAKHAFQHKWIDALPRDGKRGGGFCASSKAIKESRILTNFTGVFSDIGTLAHELGHAYHSYCLKEETTLNSSYPMPIAETASIFCESIIKDAFFQKATTEEKIPLLASTLDDAIQCIVDIYSRFLFESNLFEKRKTSTLSVNELNELMLDAQKKAYGEGLDPHTLHPYMWACKPHYYYPSSNFYNYPYAFGLLFAKGLYSQFLNEGKPFVSKYQELLKITGKNKIVDITKSVGIDITKKTFWQNSLKLIEADVNNFCAL
ncbi:MAG: oligoendopeptidase F [Bdellovibrionales bacterium RIFOXYB1_FULL_37_110]|nr:MAG: oligoendopeptidase F [Bdellovibrionales bacterium RIFOXYA1_FULL_38_20]OFZ50207.1 MAG: oligoendopeptidase F [Bdellovibrionales bacterium RIFOXYC1_FULL_37_79]OFZ57644.1 MAG: oligoendopeptidase F [Bdellovibrionales bacterium RIFOXYB1_FULL_37_110]OFZ61411.1 MAG: oligoendopeptidase F [Bdellovibrionales bacterium RIFOXYD1_FULL_36_51]